MRYLFLGAVEAELTALKERIRESDLVSFAEVGIGIAEAAVRTTEVLLAQPSLKQLSVVFVGSSGTRDHDIPLLSLVVSSSCNLYDHEAELERAYYPEPYGNRVEADKELLHHFEASLGNTAQVAPIVSPLSIASVEVEQRELFFENLELFGVASACHRFEVPWVSISAVTNHVGPEAHEQWRENCEAAAQITAEAISRYFEQH